jgi:drug/metabolite transporter, DME family
MALTGSTLLAPASGLIVTSYLAVVPMGLACVLYGTGLRNTTVTAATTLSLLEPVVAALLSVLVASERAKSWIGMGLIGLGRVLVTTRR